MGSKVNLFFSPLHQSKTLKFSSTPHHTTSHEETRNQTQTQTLDLSFYILTISNNSLTFDPSNMRGLTFFFFWFFTSHTFLTTTFAHTLTATQTLTTNQTLLSQNEIFVLGFFSGTHSNLYLAIWYKNTPEKTIVWVANRDNPLHNSTGSLKFGDSGNIVLVNDSGNTIWSSNQTIARNPVLQLLDSGNLVIREANSDNTNFLWQSFDFPTDTLLPGMYLGWNMDTGIEKHITSWKINGQDPSTGDYSFKMNYHGLPEIFLWNNNEIIYRSGPWNGDRFSGVPEMQPDTDSINFTFTANEHEVYYSFSIMNQSLFSRLSVTSDGELQRLTWIQSNKVWTKFWYAPKDQCDGYRECGPNGICDSNASPVCKCLRGFRPKDQQAWNLRDGSGGCVRNNDLDCKSDKFLHMMNVKLPETRNVFVNRSMTIVECEDLCHRNCSCSGYANVEITNGGSGCVMWNSELIDMRQYDEGGQDLYVRLAASDLGASHETNDRAKIVGITISSSVVLFGLLGIYFIWRKRKLQSKMNENQEQRGSLQRNQHPLMNEVVFSSNRYSGERNMDELELPMFDFNTITMATNNFSETNKLGQGGFGSVYKGRLMEGQEIAVKRLSKTSGQGVDEFKNEVKLIIKLQHRNLVRLSGCCIEKDERLLVYEYMENRSLDSILFDKAKTSLLDWKIRFNIICGIARGLLYLHHDSRFRIIHRDLKASNILLDKDMNPKISDFGMARMFHTDQTEANTLRVVGTYGYMSPEYAMDGNFSVKSDVFSFGVLVLEIISGKKNKGFYYANDELNLLGNVWRKWKEGNALELIDSSIGDSYSPSEALRCIHIGLLCVQERAEDRPKMPSVILMLNSETASMPVPRNPGFSVGRNPTETNSSSSKQDESWSVNQVTVTVLDAR
ncbi:PREDICTED: receptor-like serine/threonine-protein kinase SD1-8 [Lupinus angustifolius]|uniref:receptor-like serine/threonine-protein kinase SD1-8 n=1 Tax=Lupinus angustifolius TaxID=3871 RepID=UPI00092E73A0|nr:PREDICTED: receptor-like serine/threonine-protein kinase SD1-8 [Lupinus angustifolius]